LFLKCICSRVLIARTANVTLLSKPPPHLHKQIRTDNISQYLPASAFIPFSMQTECPYLFSFQVEQSDIISLVA